MRYLLAVSVTGAFFLSCQADTDAPGATGPEPAETTSSPTTSASASPSKVQEPADNDIESVFRDVEGFSFENADAETRRSLRSIFDRNAGAPVLDLTMKDVYRDGTRLPAEVLVARFDVQQSERKDFFTDLLLEIAKTYDDAQPALDGLGVRFVAPGREAVAYPSMYGDLVYVLSPQPNTALPIANALVEAEPR